ncbi:ribonuclease [Coprothermobacteraceae bacterium]|nr:ribonuclease [Coprothermobacteraceae bacterium]
MHWFKQVFDKLNKDNLGFFAGAFSFFMFFSTAALALFLFLLFGEQVSFAVVGYLSPDYEELLQPVLRSLSITPRLSWWMLLPLAWGSTNVFASLEHAASQIAGRMRRPSMVTRLVSFALVLVLAFSVWAYALITLFFKNLPSWFVTLGFYTLFFAGLNLFLDNGVQWKYAIGVGFMQAAVWQALSSVLGYYVKSVSTNVVFKVASAVPVVLFWYYVLAHVVLIGWETLTLLKTAKDKQH